jgi:ATP-dependent Lon protease
MTGELTLGGQVLPVGGIKDKILAAHRIGVVTIILPKKNEKDLADLPDDIREQMTFILAEHMDQVLEQALVEATGQPSQK